MQVYREKHRPCLRYALLPDIWICLFILCPCTIQEIVEKKSCAIYENYEALYKQMFSTNLKVMKIIYITCSVATCYLMFVKFKATYDGNHDSMRAEFLIVPAAGLACLINHNFEPMEILWTFSIYLECVAILPQLFMISKVLKKFSKKKSYKMFFRPGKLKQLHRTIYSPKAHTAHFTLLTGSTVTTSKNILTGLLLLPV